MEITNRNHRSNGSKLRPILVALSILVAIVGIVWVVVNRPMRNDGDTAARTVRVAANLPLSGALATYGKSVQEGVLLALAELPERERFECDWQDNTGAPQMAATVFQRQLLDKPDIYMSGVKPQTMAIADKVAAEGLPHFVWIFDVNINKGTSNSFRTWVSYKLEPDIYVQYARDVGATRVAIIYVQLPHTVEEFEQLVIPRLKSQGVSELLVEPFDFGRSDFRDIAVKVRDFNPDLLVLNGFQAELVGLVRALRPFNLIKEGNTIATYDMLDAAKILGADEKEGIRVVAPRFETRSDDPRVQAFRSKFEAKYSKSPLYTHAFAYDMAMIIASAAKHTPVNADAWISALRATDLEGITGRLQFDSDGDLLTPLEVGVYRNGLLEPLKE